MGKSIHEYAMSNTQKLHRWSLLNIARYYRAGEILPDPHIQNIIQCDTERYFHGRLAAEKPWFPTIRCRLLTICISLNSSSSK